jgi:hypothetical protein
MLFWPLKASKTKLRFIIDSETVGTEEYKQFRSIVSRYHQSDINHGIQISTNKLPLRWYGGKGHRRQQLLMFYADGYTNAEYIGFADTDCKFITFVDREDLFEDGMPVINGRIGTYPANDWWLSVPASTQWLLGGLEEPMRCMSYFPVVIKAVHLKKMREYIFKVHNIASDDHRVFNKYMSDKFSQFNAMCAYLWHFHRSEYTWYVHSTDAHTADAISTEVHQHRPNNSRPTTAATATAIVPGQLADMSVFTTEMRRPKPRIAIHTRYQNHSEQITQEGYCRSPPFPKLNRTMQAFCTARYPLRETVIAGSSGSNGIFADMHVFEDANFYAVADKGGMLAEQRLRYERIKGCNHIWDKELLVGLLR